MGTRHELTATEKTRGRGGSALVRAAAKDAFLWQVRYHLIELAREGRLRPTLRERAAQLNALGVRTTRGLLLDEQKLSPVLMELGAHANTIKLLLNKVEDAADEFDVDDAIMADQLWHEWLYHHTRVMIEQGSIFGLNEKQPFVFKPVPPEEWNKNRPEKRDIRVKLWWYGKTPVIPPQARLTYALFGMFGYRKAKRLSGNKKRFVFISIEP